MRAMNRRELSIAREKNIVRREGGDDLSHRDTKRPYFLRTMRASLAKWLFFGVPTGRLGLPLATVDLARFFRLGATFGVTVRCYNRL
jgi:hypothetical protein